MNTNLKYLFGKIEKVKKLHFVVNHPIPSLNIQLNCDINVTQPNKSSIITQELGDWINKDGQKVISKNIYRWTAKNASIIKLEHLRFGKTKPIFLVDFYNEKNNMWKSLKPHICEKDKYSAEVLISATNIKLIWHIESTKHTYNIVSTYYN